jgi:hypothetical protein
MDGQDDIPIVVLARELHGHLDLIDLRLELVDERLDVRIDGLALALQLQQNVELFRFGVQRLGRGEPLLYPRALSTDLLRRLRIVPDSGNGNLPLNLLERLARGVEVKDSSGPIAAGL